MKRNDLCLSSWPDISSSTVDGRAVLFGALAVQRLLEGNHLGGEGALGAHREVHGVVVRLQDERRPRRRLAKRRDVDVILVVAHEGHHRGDVVAAVAAVPLVQLRLAVGRHLEGLPQRVGGPQLGRLGAAAHEVRPDVVVVARVGDL